MSKSARNRVYLRAREVVDIATGEHCLGLVPATVADVAKMRERHLQAGQVLQHTDAAVNDPSVMYELTRTLQEVSAAARSVRLLSGYLERNPSALLSGRKAPQAPAQPTKP